MIIDGFEVEWKVPEVMERFTIERIVEDISLEIVLVQWWGQDRDHGMSHIFEIVNYRFQVR